MFNLFIKNATNEASISPERVPIVTPANGVNPIEVSTDLPPSTAVIEAPLPKWQVMILILQLVYLTFQQHGVKRSGGLFRELRIYEL